MWQWIKYRCGICVPIYRVEVYVFPFIWIKPGRYTFTWSYGETSYWAGPLRLMVYPTRDALLESNRQ